MRRVLDRQREAFLADLPVSAALRKDRLRRARALLLENRQALVAAVTDDFGHRSAEQSLLTDIMIAVLPLAYAEKRVEAWMKREKRKVDFPLGLLGGKAFVEFQPKGVVGVISPWNAPVNLTFAPLAGIFASGNRAMIKPSELTERTSQLMAELAARYFAPEELSFVVGGPEISKAFAALPFDHLLFTGATAIARHILSAAADNLVPVTLELGGKSPTLIGRSANIQRASTRIALGKMVNAGQLCLSPDYLLVPRELENAIIEGIKNAVAEMYPTLLSNADYTSVINTRHRERLEDYISDAEEKGAKVVVVNPAGEAFTASSGNKMPLHLVRNVTDDMRIMQEEIFGPILPVLIYDRIEEAVSYVKAHDRPLALYYFGTDPSEERRVLDQTMSGGVTVNDVIFHVAQEELPFGGIGPSGMGAYHGKDGFKTFSHAKAVYRQPNFDVAKLAGFKPPYGAATRRALKLKMK